MYSLIKIIYLENNPINIELRGFRMSMEECEHQIKDIILPIEQVKSKKQGLKIVNNSKKIMVYEDNKLLYEYKIAVLDEESFIGKINDKLIQEDEDM